MDPARTIVFVCLHGTAKSVVAAAHCERLAAARGLAVRAAALGIEPEPDVPPRSSRRSWPTGSTSAASAPGR